MKIKFYVIGLVTALMTVFVFSCGKETDKKIEIAIAGPYSGDLAGYGIPTRRAVELVFEGMDNIVLNAQDDQCDAGIAVNVASNIIGTEAVAVVGHICSGATTTALDIYKEVGITSISPSATTPPLTKSGQYTPVFFRTIAPDDLQGILQADYMVNKLNVKKVVTIHDNGDYGKGLAQYTKDALEAQGVEIVLFEGLVAGAVDYSTIVNKISSANVDAVMFGGYHPEASKLLNQLRRAGVTIPFISGDGVKSDGFIKLGGKVVEGALATGPRDYSANALYQEARKQHLEKYSEEPGNFYESGYAAAQVLKQTFEALQEQGQEVTRESVNKYISDTSNSYDTAIGQLSFDEWGDAKGIGFAVYVVKNGKFVEVK